MSKNISTPGQSPLFPGAVRSGNLILTSGIVHPAVLKGEPTPEFREEARGALDEVLRCISELGGSVDSVMRVEAFLGRAEDYAAWNEVFTAVWPTPGPARITVVTSFAIPTIGIEIQATASCD